jgi:N-succinyldiaminopimelate aminotransferase
MNPRLDQLRPYPFERLRALFHGNTPPAGLAPIQLSIGEPRHPSPPFVRQALADNLGGLSSYPATIGREDLRTTLANWLMVRFRLAALDPAHQVIPTLGSREALFSLAQAVLDPCEREALVLCPNPFYQIYEGAALLGGAQPWFLNVHPEQNYSSNWSEVPAEVWPRVRLVFTCSPGNPTGVVMTLEEWQQLFELSDRHGFVIAADECYSEIYFDQALPPLGALEAAQRLGRSDFRRLIVLGSLSKRSNVPGLRSGYAAGDAELIRRFTLYRTYHGSAMSPAVQAASNAAWQDEAHVVENRRLYREKFKLFRDILAETIPLHLPAAGFYYWMRTPIDDLEFARRLHAEENVTVLPGTFLAREAHGLNPGRDHVRIALVSTLAECRESAERIRRFLQSLSKASP